MKNNLFRQAILLVAAVLLSTSFWSCSKNEEPEPTPPAVTVTGVTLNKTSTSIQVGSEVQKPLRQRYHPKMPQTRK